MAAGSAQSVHSILFKNWVDSKVEMNIEEADWILCLLNLLLYKSIRICL